MGRSIDDLVALGLPRGSSDEPGAQPARLHADDRIGARIERRLLAEDLDADDVFLQLAAAPADRFDDDEADEALEAIDLREGLAREDAIELVAESPCPRFSTPIMSRSGSPSGTSYSGYLVDRPTS